MSNSDPNNIIKSCAKQLALEAGFCLAGVASVDDACYGGADAELPASGHRDKWLAAGMHADMDYLRQRVELTKSPWKNFPQYKSALVLACRYGAGSDNSSSLISRYARGRDYHKVLFNAATGIARQLEDRFDCIETRVCVDTAPVPERTLAVLAGLGWIGRSGMLVNPRFGSRLLLAEIFLNVPLAADSPLANGCSDCDACVRACPNGAIVGDGLVDARRCNSWATIENRGGLDGDKFDLAGCVFGCDRCADACSYNTQCEVNACDGEKKLTSQLAGPSSLAKLTLPEILQLSPDKWDEYSRGTAVRRCKYDGLIRNAAIVAGQSCASDCLEHLKPLTRSDWPHIASAAQWAIEKISQNS